MEHPEQAPPRLPLQGTVRSIVPVHLGAHCTTRSWCQTAINETLGKISRQRTLAGTGGSSELLLEPPVHKLIQFWWALRWTKVLLLGFFCAHLGGRGNEMCPPHTEMFVLYSQHRSAHGSDTQQERNVRQQASPCAWHQQQQTRAVIHC